MWPSSEWVGRPGWVLAGWGVAAYPYLVPPGLTVASAAGPPQTMPVILAVLVAGFAVTIPSLLLLFRIFSRPPAHADR